MSKQRRELALIAAQAGDEQAFSTVLHEFDGLIWQQFQQQRVRENPADWYQECRIVMHRCLKKLPQQHCGVLTVYFKQALYHHVTSLWRSEYQSKFGPVLNDDCLTYCAIPATSVVWQTEFFDVFQKTYVHLNDIQKELLLLRFEGYTMKECAKKLNKSNSWCYQQWKLIQNHFLCLKPERQQR